MARRKKIRVGRVIILLFLVFLLLVFGYFAINKFAGSKKTEKVKEISSIKGYNYTLRADATDYYKKLFKKLSKVLGKKDVDMDKYASLVGEMFVCDFFNLDNKISKNDVGGREFVYSEYVEDFEKYAMDTMYKSVQSNVYGNRKQSLPIVTNVSISKESSESFKYGDNVDTDAYVFNFKVDYKKDLGYQDKGKLVLIHNDKKIEVASMSS